ncbi:MAG: glycosyltransferase family 2 protein [Candidatus Omnitrophica bacterium]|nr:glycosyltransferase family 2 protein [Candidatus Omnitrophota bacterium]
MEVSIIIVTWNAEKFINKCLDSVFSQDFSCFEVIVVDNSSTDKTIGILQSYEPRIKLMRNDENKGFCFANNQAIGKAKGKYIFTLNSDIILEKNYLSVLVQCLSEHHEIGMAQGKFLRMNGRIIDGTGLKLGLAFRFLNFNEGKTDSMREFSPKMIFGPCAAAAVYKRKLFEDIKYENEYFDNSFFFLVDDFDVAWRAHKKGWKAMYVPQAICYHYRASSAHKSSFKQFLTFRNRYFLLLKNATWKDFLKLMFFFPIYDLPRLIFMLIFNPYAIKAIAQIIKNIPLLMKKRRYLERKI